MKLSAWVGRPVAILAVLIACSSIPGGVVRAEQDPSIPPPPPVPPGESQQPGAPGGVPQLGGPEAYQPGAPGPLSQPGGPGAYQQPGGPGAAPQPGGPEVLTRGPIHEAFATPVVFNPVAPIVVPQPPPNTPINEIPPDQKPAGADVEWIPGYWAWDEGRNGYIWVSGVWRDIPPGRQWIPGYWSQVNGGFGWTSGFWAPVNSGGPLNYLPPPPESLEAGPNSPQPGENFAWAPGSWVWQGQSYNWRPGYWYPVNPDWVWSPDSYQATPGGYVYNQGFWDYSLARRGLPFAPVAFNNFGGGGIGGPFNYTPSLVLPVAGLLANLFVQPNYGHYYFGDYYNSVGLGGNRGYVPWFEFRNNRLGYDPLYSSMAALNAGRPNWDQGYRNDYRYRLDHADARPLPTYAAERNLIEQRRGRGEDVRNLGLAVPLNQWANNPNANHAILPVAAEHRAELQRRQADMTNFQQQRIRQEEQGRQALAGQNLRAEEAKRTLFRNELPRSPIAAAANPRFESRGLGVPPGHPPGQAAFRPEFNHGPEVPTISHRPEARPGGEPRREPERAERPRR